MLFNKQAMMLFQRWLKTTCNRPQLDKVTGEEMTIDISDAAVAKLKELKSKYTDSKIVRLQVDGGGCHGLSLSFSLSDRKDIDSEGDVEFTETTSGVSIVTDSISLPYITGSTVDYTDTLMRQAFTLTNNPQAGSQCGCGTSFDIQKKK